MQLFYFLELHTEIIVTKHIGEYNKLCYTGEGKNAKILWIFLATLSVDARKTHILFDKIHLLLIALGSQNPFNLSVFCVSFSITRKMDLNTLIIKNKCIDNCFLYSLKFGRSLGLCY